MALLVSEGEGGLSLHEFPSDICELLQQFKIHGAKPFYLISELGNFLGLSL